MLQPRCHHVVNIGENTTLFPRESYVENKQ